MGLLQQGDRTDPVHEHRKIIPVSRFFKKGRLRLADALFPSCPDATAVGEEPCSSCLFFASGRPFPPPAFFQKDGQPPAAPIPKRPSHASTARNASGHPFRIRPSCTHGPMRITRPTEAEMVIRKSDDTGFSGTSLSCSCDKNDSFSFARFSDAPIRDKNVARSLLSPRDKTQEDSNRSLLRSNRPAIFRSHGSYPGTAAPCKGLHPSFERAESEPPVRIEPSYSDEFRPAAQLFPILVFCRASTASTLGRQTDRQTDSGPPATVRSFQGPEAASSFRAVRRKFPSDRRPAARTSFPHIPLALPSDRRQNRSFSPPPERLTAAPRRKKASPPVFRTKPAVFDKARNPFFRIPPDTIPARNARQSPPADNCKPSSPSLPLKSPCPHDSPSSISSLDQFPIPPFRTHETVSVFLHRPCRATKRLGHENGVLPDMRQSPLRSKPIPPLYRSERERRISVLLPRRNSAGMAAFNRDSPGRKRRTTKNRKADCLGKEAAKRKTATSIGSPASEGADLRQNPLEAPATNPSSLLFAARTDTVKSRIPRHDNPPRTRCAVTRRKHTEDRPASGSPQLPSPAQPTVPLSGKGKYKRASENSDALSRKVGDSNPRYR